jgi:hypothetical protein
VDVAATKFKVFIDIVTTLFSVNLVGQIGISLHVVTNIFAILISTLAFLADDGLFELEAARKACLSQLEKHQADTLAVPGLQLVGVHVHIDAKVLQFNDNVLTGSDGVIVLVPSGNLVLVDGKQPRDETDEVDELLRGLAGGSCEVGLRNWFETPVQNGS